MASEGKRSQEPDTTAIPLAHGGSERESAQGTQACVRSGNCIKKLYFFGDLWYNRTMIKKNDFQTSTGETVTISRAEYEKFLGQEQQLLPLNERLAELEHKYQPGRGAKHPKAFLTGYKGYIHTDGFVAYHDLGDDITVVGCTAHARRKIDEALKSLPKGQEKSSSAYQGLVYCDLLFAIEKGFDEKNATPEERYKERLEQAKPVLDAMFAWANSRNIAPKSAQGKALHYLKEQWPYLTGYLKDGRLKLSNNRAERSIKPFVIDRKNFLFANTPKGATGSAVMFSLIQTAIENGLDPYKYLTWLMKTAKDADLDDPETVQLLLPWNAPAECHAARKEATP